MPDFSYVVIFFSYFVKKVGLFYCIDKQRSYNNPIWVNPVSFSSPLPL